MKEIVPIVPKNNAKSGNTIQISPAKRWCFTLNNYTTEELDTIKNISSNSSKYWIIGFEVGESGTPHLQGYIEFKDKIRPFNVMPINRIHWEKSKGTRTQNYVYCTKEGHFIINGIETVPIETIETLRPWQQSLWDLFNTKPDQRTIHWIHEPEGGIGKSSFVRYVCAKREDAIVLSGKGADIKNAILQMKEKKGYFPKIILIDLPRSYKTEWLCLPSIEDIKNGCFYSGKYEGGMVLMNHPHIAIFANTEPDLDQLSKDRWNIISL